MSTVYAPTILGNVRLGDRLVHNVGICVLAPQLIEIGCEELKIGVLINFVPKVRKQAQSRTGLDVGGEGRIRALRDCPEKGLLVSKSVRVRLTEFRE
jgi:hypothetical protein